MIFFMKHTQVIFLVSIGVLSVILLASFFIFSRIQVVSWHTLSDSSENISTSTLSAEPVQFENIVEEMEQEAYPPMDLSQKHKVVGGGFIEVQDPSLGDRLVDIVYTASGDEKVLFSDVDLMFGNGNGLEYFTSDRKNIYGFSISDGDVCYSVRRDYIIDIETQDGVSIENLHLCAAPFLKINVTPSDSYIIALHVQESCVSRVLGARMVECKTVGEYVEDSLSVNGEEVYSFSEPFKAMCGGNAGIDGMCTQSQYTSFTYLGIDPDMKDVYFSVSNTEQKHLFAFDLETKTVRHIDTLPALLGVFFRNTF